MGLIRLLLAISVVMAHSNEDLMVGGQIAVQLFYIISGFLMSLILNTKNTYDDPRKFYLNRALRIYPIYFSVALLSLIAQLLANPKFLELYCIVPFSADLLLVFSNLLIFGQDWIMFSGVENESLVFMTDFTKSNLLLHSGLLVPQAWTLSVELSFYLIAPFVLRSLKMTITLLILSLLFRIFLLYDGLGFQDPWTYRFFPLELSLFLLGALVHKYLVPFWRGVMKKEKFSNIDFIATMFLIAFITMYTFLPVPHLYKAIMLYFCFLFFLPLAFTFQENRPIDKSIGNLSYPLYIGHLLVIWVIAFICRKIDFTNPHIITALNILLALCFAYILNILVGNNIEVVRNRVRNSVLKTK